MSVMIDDLTSFRAFSIDSGNCPNFTLSSSEITTSALEGDVAYIT